MNGLIARIHPLQQAMEFPDTVDLFHHDDGQEVLSGVIQIDLLSDLGVSDDAIARIMTGEEIEVVCMAAYDLQESGLTQEAEGR